MSVHLLDVNVLIALMWPAHEDHTRVQEWFGKQSKLGWATCPFTEAAVIRILSNPAFSRDAVAPQQALTVLESNMKHPAHHFWADEISIIDALRPLKNRIVGHRQVTDAYLLGLARHRKGKLATLDRAVLGLLSSDERQEGTVAVI
jgi:uncharacterized protein